MTSKDFTAQNPVLEMWEFFEENPHFRLLNYEPIKDGVRVFFVTII